MVERKKSKGPPSDEPLDGTGRFLKKNPEKFAEETVDDVLKGRQRAKKQIADARKEIEDGARPRKGRFRI